MTEQKESYKNFVEDIARIWLEYLIVHSVDGVNLEEEVTDQETGEQTVQIVNVPQVTLEQLKASVKIDITPKGVYDKFAQEQTLENLLTGGYFNIQRLSELEVYANLLDDDSVAPKMKILEGIERMKEEQRKIAMIDAQAKLMQQRASQFLMEGPDAQADEIANAMMQMQGQEMPIEGEAEVAEAEANLEEPEVPVGV